jgi:hypothetical protein
LPALASNIASKTKGHLLKKSKIQGNKVPAKLPALLGISKRLYPALILIKFQHFF